MSLQLLFVSSTQNPTGIQEKVAEVLGIPQNKVVCTAKRLGGGFGGKEFKPMCVASYAAIVAQR